MLLVIGCILDDQEFSGTSLREIAVRPIISVRRFWRSFGRRRLDWRAL